MKNSKPQFKRGELVTWTSQANGSTKTKVGVIIEVVKARTVPSKLGQERQRPFGLLRVWHGQQIGGVRPEVSYVVALLDKNGKPSKSQWKRYWPRTSKLTRFERV